MHPAAYQFVQRAITAEPITGRRVLEVGSYDVNATAQGLVLRNLFVHAAEYVGLDERPGPGVDLVADAAVYVPDEPYDIVVCCEMLEHTSDPAAVIGSLHEMLKPGGLLILTAAAPQRRPHNCDGEPWRGVEPYTAIDPDALRGWLSDGWLTVDVEHHPRIGDVYATAYRAPDADEPAPEPEPITEDATA